MYNNLVFIRQNFRSLYYLKMYEHLCSVVSDSVILWTVTHQTPLSMEFSRQEYRSGLLFPSTGYLPDPEIKPVSPALVGRFFITVQLGKPLKIQLTKPRILIHVQSQNNNPGDYIMKLQEKKLQKSRSLALCPTFHLTISIHHNPLGLPLL